MDSVIYFDNAATSWPKPAAVRSALDLYFGEAGGNPGRSGHRMSIAAARVVGEAREGVARLLGVADPSQIVLTKNATEGLNIAITGMLSPGDHAITTSIEHNSVMRPLRFLESRGLELTVIKCRRDGTIDAQTVAAAFRPTTKLLVTVHGSNVVGSILPIDEMAALARDAGVAYLVDASQTAGSIPIDVTTSGVDLMAFPGHKGLLGPTGTGALYVADHVHPAPIMRGGTGSRSDLETQPEFPPDLFESGTVNVAGLVGLAAGVDYLLNTGISNVAAHERALVARFIAGAADLDGITVYGPPDIDDRCGVLSFNVDGLPPSDVATILDRDFGILSRAGLHCSPGAHRTLGTFPTGSVRFGFGPTNEFSEVDVAIDAVSQIASWAGAESAAESTGG